MRWQQFSVEALSTDCVWTYSCVHPGFLNPGPRLPQRQTAEQQTALVSLVPCDNARKSSRGLVILSIKNQPAHPIHLDAGCPPPQLLYRRDLGLLLRRAEPALRPRAALPQVPTPRLGAIQLPPAASLHRTIPTEAIHVCVQILVSVLVGEDDTAAAGRSRATRPHHQRPQIQVWSSTYRAPLPTTGSTCSNSHRTSDDVVRKRAAGQLRELVTVCHRGS